MNMDMEHSRLHALPHEAGAGIQGTRSHPPIVLKLRICSQTVKRDTCRPRPGARAEARALRLRALRPVLQASPRLSFSCVFIITVLTTHASCGVGLGYGFFFMAFQKMIYPRHIITKYGRTVALPLEICRVDRDSPTSEDVHVARRRECVGEIPDIRRRATRRSRPSPCLDRRRDSAAQTTASTGATRQRRERDICFSVKTAVCAAIHCRRHCPSQDHGQDASAQWRTHTPRQRRHRI
jgi:hypothetical protein